MANDPTAPLFAEDDLGADVAFYTKLIEEEVMALLEVLPQAVARQWYASPVPRSRDDTHQRATGERSDPTADAALDPRRLALRAVVLRSHQALHDAAVTVRGARLALERSIARYDGEK